MSQSMKNPGPDNRAKGHLAYLAFVTLCYFAASSVPTPLYHLYQQQWGFSPAMLTLIFAIYAFSQLLALLTVGSLSDYLGRRPVIFAALLLQLTSLGLFIMASDAYGLLTARLVQGFATGLATSALGAAMLDTDTERGPLLSSVAPMFGMAAGALSSSVLAEYAPMPLVTGYALLLVTFVLQTAYLLRVRETVQPVAGALGSLRPRLSVPVQARTTLLMVLPVNTAAWALGGFFLSLMPSLLAKATGSTSSIHGGAAVATLTLVGAGAILKLRQRPPRVALLVGASFLAAGLIVLLAAIGTGALGLFFAGAAVAGVGFGSSFLGSMRLLMPLAHAHERAGLMSTFLVLSYLAFCVPALGAGLSARRFGLILTGDVFGAALLGLALLALASLLLPRRSQPALP